MFPYDRARPRRVDFGWLLLTLPILTHGCLLDNAAGREPLDATWQARMLAGGR